MSEKQWFKRAILAVLSQNKSDIEKMEEIVELIESLEENK